MTNELVNRMKQISEILPTPENEMDLRNQLQILCMIAEKEYERNISQSREISDSIKAFTKVRLSELENRKLLVSDCLPKAEYELNELLLKIAKKLDKDNKRISFCPSGEKIEVCVNERAIFILIERLMFFCRNRMMLELDNYRIKIKSDCSFSELIRLYNCKSDLMLIINKILDVHSLSMFSSSAENGSEIIILLNGMLCDKTNNC